MPGRSPPSSPSSAVPRRATSTAPHGWWTAAYCRWAPWAQPSCPTAPGAARSAGHPGARRRAGNSRGTGSPLPETWRYRRGMDLPLQPPVAPMLAKSVKDVPEGDYLYEPKWDGFRSIIFKDGDDVVIGSRNERPMTRYFPELVEAARERLPERCVVDGEIVVVTADRLDFEALLQRIHPAESRVRRLAGETPASFVAFDLLALGDEDLTSQPLEQRRARLEEALEGVSAPVHLTQATRDTAVAREWLDLF